MTRVFRRASWSKPPVLAFMGVCLGSLFNGCGPEQTALQMSPPKQVIGDDDLTPIDSRYLASRVIRAIGRMDLGCTVSHLGGGIAITAGHCMAGSGGEGRLVHQACDEERYKVIWGLTYGSQGLLTSHCQEIIAAEFNEERDYAILRVWPQPEDALEVAGAIPAVGERINILSHPRKRPLEWSGYCTMEGYYPNSSYQKVGYQCDTEGGSSGAAILNDAFQVVGIHNFYDGTYDRNGGTLAAATPLLKMLK